MFKPLKDFITFIQKNSSNTNADKKLSSKNMNITNSAILTQLKGMDNQGVTLENKSVLAAHIQTAQNLDEDDIELQIKSSIMLKRPTLQSIPKIISNSGVIATLPDKTTAPADHNHNNQPKLQHLLPEEDDELSDFKHDPMQNLSKYCFRDNYEGITLECPDDARDESVLRNEDVLDEDCSAEIEDAKKTFIGSDSELNSSVSSSNNGDPLAIDISSVVTDVDLVISPLESPTSEEKANVAENHAVVWTETVRVQNSASAQTYSNPLIKSDVQNSPNQTQGGELNEETERNDNSDSGLGTETSSSLLQTTIENSTTECVTYNDDQFSQSFETKRDSSRNDLIDCGSLTTSAENSSNLQKEFLSTTPVTAKPLTTVIRSGATTIKIPIRSNLKRRFCEVDANINRESAKTCGQQSNDPDTLLPKKPKRSVTFDSIEVYYFSRQQGFSCVPSAGGCTLGMGATHIGSRRLTLAEHAAELRRAHRLQLQEINPRGSSSEDTDESEEEYLSDGSSDLDADSNGFLQPVPPKQRRALLKAAGVRKIDTSEKVECRNIRNSREVCGCTCRDFCDPETCTCSRSGIKCQVDRAMFPCGCSRDACGNTHGRVEFNPSRVRTHFIHTIMRLDIENRQQQPPMPTSLDPTPGILRQSVSNTALGTTSDAVNYYTNMLSQSNYNSDYASLTFAADASTNYLQQRNLMYSNDQQRESSNQKFGSLDDYNTVHAPDSRSIFMPNANSFYGEILPSYTSETAITTTIPCKTDTVVPENVNFTNSSYIAYEEPIQPQQLQGRHPKENTKTNYSTPCAQISNSDSMPSLSDLSPCANPSRPPFGAAVACSAQTPSSSLLPLTPCPNLTSLGIPKESSSYLAQPNDSIQNNRKTTAVPITSIGNNSFVLRTDLTKNSLKKTSTETEKFNFVCESENFDGMMASNDSLTSIFSPLPPNSQPPQSLAPNEHLYHLSGTSVSSSNNSN